MTRRTKAIGIAGVRTALAAPNVCSGVLMAGMDLDRLRTEELTLVPGLIRTTIDESRGDGFYSAAFERAVLAALPGESEEAD
jgi:hypothetical protein